MSHTRMTTLPFLFLALSPFIIFESDNALISRPLCKSYTLLNIIMILGKTCRTGQDNVSCTRMKTLAFLLLELSPLVLFEIDFVSTL